MLPDLENRPYENKKVVVIGGGTGPFNLLRGLVQRGIPRNITTIYTTWDDGKSTGVLRSELGGLPQGDKRRQFVALIPDPRKQQIIMELFEHRMKFGRTQHAVGNIMLLALDQINEGNGIEQAKILLDVESHIYGVTKNPMRLGHKDQNATELIGEHFLDERGYNPDNPVSTIFFENKPRENKDAIEAVLNADTVVFSSGSLYGSILPNLRVPGFRQAILETKADLMLVLNVMTETGQTDGYTASRHIAEFNRYLGDPGRLNYLIAHQNHIDPDVLERYRLEKQEPVFVDEEACLKAAPNLRIVKGQIANYYRDEHLIRHDPDRLAIAVLDPKYFMEYMADQAA